MSVPDYPRDRPTARDAAKLIRELYATEQGGVGCCLHVLTDDGNYGKGSAEWCLENAQKHAHPRCIELASLLVQLTPTQQRRAVRLAWASPPAPADPTSPEPQRKEPPDEA